MGTQLPESLRSVGWIRCRVIDAVPDTVADPDEHPDARGATDVTVVLTPSTSLIRVVDLDYPAFVRKQPWRFPVQPDGYIRDDHGNDAIALIAGWWTVSFEKLAVDPFPIEVTTVHTKADPLDLAPATGYVPPPFTQVQAVALPIGGAVGDILARGASGTLAWASVPDLVAIYEEA